MRKKSLMFAAVSLIAVLFCGFLFSNPTIETRAEESEATSQVAEEEPVAKEDPTVAKWISDRIVPLIGSFSVANVIGIVVSVGTAVMKARGDKRTEKTIDEQNAKVERLENCISVLRQENERYVQFSKEMLSEYRQTLSKTSAVMDEVSKSVGEVSASLVEQNVRIEEVEKMKNTIEVSCNLTAKMLALSDVAVKSGIAEDAQRLVQTLSNEEVNDDAKEE